MATCVVTYTDPAGQHSVEVQADSVYEAALRGIAALRADPLLADADIPVVEVVVRPPPVTHRVALHAIDRYLAHQGPSAPRDVIRRQQIAALRDAIRS